MAESLSPGVMHIHGIITNTYHVWRGLRDRCRNKRNPKWAIYGGRGITFSSRWDDFLTFQRDMGERPTLQHSIERIDNNGDYEPGNCKWATKKEQVRNRRSSRFVDVDGVRMHVIDAVGGEAGRDYRLAMNNIYRGKSWDAPRRKITPHTAEQVAEVKWLLSRGVPPRDIMAAYEMTQATVSLINLGKQWASVLPKEAKIPPISVSKRMVPYILAIKDWKAPFEVKKLVSPYSKGYLMRLVNKGLAEYSAANNTYRATKKALRAAYKIVACGPNGETILLET